MWTTRAATPPHTTVPVRSQFRGIVPARHPLCWAAAPHPLQFGGRVPPGDAVSKRPTPARPPGLSGWCCPGSAPLGRHTFGGAARGVLPRRPCMGVPVSTSPVLRAMPSASRPSNASAAANGADLGARGCRNSEPGTALSPEVILTRLLTPSGCPNAVQLGRSRIPLHVRNAISNRGSGRRSCPSA
jgi:hypothetical protein